MYIHKSDPILFHHISKLRFDSLCQTKSCTGLVRCSYGRIRMPLGPPSPASNYRRSSMPGFTRNRRVSHDLPRKKQGLAILQCRVTRGIHEIHGIHQKVDHFADSGLLWLFSLFPKLHMPSGWLRMGFPLHG